MNELENIRIEIDEIDKTIVEAFCKRMGASLRVADYKIKNNMQVTDRKRELQLLKSRLEMLEDKSFETETELLFEYIMSLSRARQAKMIANIPCESAKTSGKVAFQGVVGAYSYLAAETYFEDVTNAIACKTFEDVFVSVLEDEAQFGILPIENSYVGSIHAVYDLLNKYSLEIVGEYKLRITHSLLGMKDADLADIKEVYSHEQALQQCAEFLSKQKNIEQHETLNTAVSAKYVADEKCIYKAAIANKRAAEIYGLKVIAENIHDSEDNTTRFIVISKQANNSENANKASVNFVLEHNSGALAKALNVFAQHDLNMVRIESRPCKNRNFEYIFYVDFEGENVFNCIKEVVECNEKLFTSFKLLGIYEASR